MMNELAEAQIAAEHAVQKIRKSDIFILQSLKKPPPIVCQVFDVVYVLLSKTKPKKPGYNKHEDPFWIEGIKMLYQSDFYRRLFSLNAWNLDENRYQAAKLMLQEINGPDVMYVSAVAKVNPTINNI